MRARWLASSLLGLLLAACSTDDPPGESAADVTTDSGTTPQWQPLITADWTLPAGTEGYVCARKTIETDIMVEAFRAMIPVGTHHTLLTYGEPDQEDGVTDCNAGENRTRSLFGSGVGTDPFAFPEGVGIRIPAGSQILLNLHLFNTGTQELSGTSGTEIQVLDESEVEHEAEGILAGTIALDIPAGETTQSTGYCTMSGDFTLFAVAPHMHQIGTYARVVAESASEGDVVLHDAPYSFEEQSYRLIEPIRLLEGERVRVESTHHNTTDTDVHFGDSSLDEMCFAGIGRYPTSDDDFFCVDDASSAIPPVGGPPCAADGASGNSLGVGRRCTNGGNECGELLCVADFVEGTWGNFCTLTCAADADCGDGATCVQRDGSAIATCVPTECVDTAVLAATP